MLMDLVADERKYNTNLITNVKKLTAFDTGYTKKKLNIIL